VTDYKGNSYYFSFDNWDPNYEDFYYDGSDYNLTWISNFRPQNLKQVKTSDTACTYYTSTYTDKSAAGFQA